MQFRGVMFRALFHKIRGNNFIRDCVLFRSNVPFYWLIGVMVWTSFIFFIYAGLGLIRLSL